MFYSNEVQNTRKLFFSSWTKYRKNHPLETLEKQIVDVILSHPEYHFLLENSSEDNTAYYPELGQTNPFLHMGLHLALREQIATDRPVGIKAIFQQLLNKLADPLSVEHKMMDSLMECLWQAQRNQCLPNDQQYISQLTDLVNSLA